MEFETNSEITNPCNIAKDNSYNIIPLKMKNSFPRISHVKNGNGHRETKCARIRWVWQ